jgi:hypothetical protein
MISRQSRHISFRKTKTINKKKRKKREKELMLLPSTPNKSKINQGCVKNTLLLVIVSSDPPLSSKV